MRQRSDRRYSCATANCDRDEPPNRQRSPRHRSPLAAVPQQLTAPCNHIASLRRASTWPRAPYRMRTRSSAEAQPQQAGCRQPTIVRDNGESRALRPRTAGRRRPGNTVHLSTLRRRTRLKIAAGLAPQNRPIRRLFSGATGPGRSCRPPRIDGNRGGEQLTRNIWSRVSLSNREKPAASARLHSGDKL